MGVLLATLAALTYGVADYCGGRASRTATSVAVAFWAEAAGVLLAVILLLVLGDPFPAGRDVWLGLLTAASAAVGLVAFYAALAGRAMSVVAPLTAVISAVIPVFIGLLQGERPGPAALGGIAVAGVAIALVSGAGAAPASRPSATTLTLAVIAGIGFALVFISLDATQEVSGVWPLAIARVGSLPLIAGTGRVTRQSLRIPRPLWPLVAIGGLFDMTANVLYLFSTNHGLLAVVAVLTAMYPVTTVCLAYTLDHERLTRSQFIGLVLAVSALVLVALDH